MFGCWPHRFHFRRGSAPEFVLGASIPQHGSPSIRPLGAGRDRRRALSCIPSRHHLSTLFAERSLEPLRVQSSRPKLLGLGRPICSIRAALEWPPGLSDAVPSRQAVHRGCSIDGNSWRSRSDQPHFGGSPRFGSVIGSPGRPTILVSIAQRSDGGTNEPHEFSFFRRGPAGLRP